METIQVTLPDGKALSVPRGTTPAEIARQISHSLAKEALVARTNGDLIDQHKMGRRAGVNWFNHKGLTRRVGDGRGRRIGKQPCALGCRTVRPSRKQRSSRQQSGPLPEHFYGLPAK